MIASGSSWDRPATELFGEWADGAVRRLPLYRRLCEGTADDPEVADRVLLSPDPGQRIPNLLLAAVHDVVLARGEGPDVDGDPDVVALSAWYSSVSDETRPVGPGADDPWPHFRRLALHHPGVEQRLRTRSTQTNEVGRCATLLLALGGLMVEGRPLGLVEVGASAGLNLLLDRYGYRYTRDVGGGDSTTVGAPDSPLVLACSWRGPIEPPIPGGLPTIASRVGVDRAPIDLSDPARARWLVACQWPDQPERVHRARIALDLARGRHPLVEAGDAVADVARLVDGVDAGVLPVVISTWVLSYLAPDRQRSFVAELDRIGAERDVSLVFAEQPDVVPGLVQVGALPPRPDGIPEGSATALVRVDWRGGERLARRLADQHPHGSWVEWLDRRG